MLDHRLLRSAALAGLGEERAEAPRVEVGDRLEREVAHDDLPVRVRLAPGGDEALGQAARLAAVGENARLDLQKGFHGLSRWFGNLAQLAVAQVGEGLLDLARRVHDERSVA